MNPTRKPTTMQMRVPVTFRDVVFALAQRNNRPMRDELDVIVEQLRNSLCAEKA